MTISVGTDNNFRGILIFTIGQSTDTIVTYDYNDGTSKTTTATYTGTALTLPTPTRDGYTFQGWYDAATGDNKIGDAGDSYTPTANTTLYAHWTENTYTLSYDANTPNPWSLDASIIPYTVASMPTDASDVRVTTVSTTTPTCYQNGSTNYAIYTFKNWNTKADGSGTSYAAGADITLTEITTLYAQWTAASFSIKYYDSDNTELTGLTPATYTYGTDVIFPTPTKTGYTFKAWHQTNATGDVVTSTEKNLGDFVLYAEWEAITVTTYTITYETNGGTSVAQATNQTNLPTSFPETTQDGYTFDGWYTDANFTTKATAGASLSADITLNAKWIKNYTVTYNANEGTCTTTSQTYTGTALTLPAPTRDGYTFAGWFTDATSGTQVSDPYTPTANTTLYAHWTTQQTPTTGCETLAAARAASKNTMKASVGTVTLSNPKEGFDSPAAIKFKQSSYIQLTPKTGMSFQKGDEVRVKVYNAAGVDCIGFKIGNNSHTLSSVAKLDSAIVTAELDSIETDGTVKIYRSSENDCCISVEIVRCSSTPINTYTVTYDDNNGTGTTTNVIYTIGGDDLILPDAPTYSGYTFQGWYDAATGGNKIGDAGKTYKPSKDTTLYAHWELIPTEECNYITNKTTLSATMGYDFGNQVLYIKNKDSKYSTSQSDTCSPAKYRYYADTVIVQIKNTGSALSAIRFQGKHTGNRSVSKVEISDALDGTYTALTGYTKIDYTASDCGELGISGVNIPAGKFVKFYFSGEFRISGLCVENSSATPATTYTVTYNYNDGTNKTTQATYSGTELTLPTITRDGYTLNGWYSAATEGELIGDAGDKFTPESDTTLYAQWELHACTVIAAGTAKSDTTMHNSMIGTVDVISPSSVSTSTVAIKLNSLGYIQLTPKAGTSFQAGDEVKVTLYNAKNSSNKTIGFKLGDQTYSETIAGEKTVTITVTLTSKAIESGVVKIYRGSSDTYFVSVEISQCTTCADDIPMITTTSTSSGACDETIELKLVAPDGTTAVSAGTVQWYRNDNPIDGANGYTYTATMVGTYYATLTVNCEVQSSNTAVVESQNTPALEKNVDKRYVHDTIPYNAATVYSLFDITSKGTTSDGKQYDTHVTVRRGNNTVTTSVAVNWLREDSINTATGYIALGANYPLLQKWCKDNNLALGDSIFVWAAPVNGCNEVDTKIFDSIPIILTHRRSLGYIVTGTVNGSIFAVNSDNLSDKLYTGLQDLYDVTPLNAYAAYNYENYAAYDLLLLTDYPNANDDKTKSYVDALADLVDRKPVLSLKAHMAKLDAWKAKGFISNPIVPGNNIAKSDTAAQKTLTVLCFSHEMFTGATWDNETERTITILDSVAREKGTSGSYKGLQGFEAAASNDFMNIATIYDSKTKQTLIACCERQNVVEARFVMLSVNRGSTKCINDKGVTMIDLLLAYLLETDPNKVSDCALTFDNGGTEHRTGSGDGQWGTAANWTDGVIPTQAHNVRIEANCTVSGKVYEVANVRLNKNYTITIEPDAGLASVGKFASYETGHPISATPITDPTRITVKADDSHTGLLIHANEDQLAATVQMYSPAHYDATQTTSAGKPIRYWAYVGIPIDSAHVPENFRGAYTYLWNEATCWTRYKDGSTLPAWGGIGLSQETPLIFTFAGNLMLAKPYTFTLTNTANSNGKGMNMIGNSWTAPLQIAKLDSADFGEGLDPTIYLYNTGRDPQGGPSSTGTDYTKATAGQWMTIPIKVAAQTGYAGPKVIPAMQAFEVNFDVNATQTSASFTLDYEKLVRASSYNSDFNQKLYAPKRVVASEYEDEEEYYDDDEVEEEPTPTIEPIMLRLQMESNSKRADLYLLQGDSFHAGYDAGWDGYYQSGDTRAVGIYALSENGNLAVSAQPQLAGTTLGTITDADDDYLLTFTFTGGEGNYPVLYLNDMQQRQSTLIDNDAYYSFRTAETDMENRFVISDQPLDTQITTDLTEIVSDGENYLISNPAGEQMHIAIYDAAGRLCGYMQTADTMIQLEMPAAQGVYMVHAQGEHSQKVVKIVR